MSKANWVTVNEYEDIAYKSQMASRGSRSIGRMYAMHFRPKTVGELFSQHLSMPVRTHPSVSYCYRPKGRRPKTASIHFAAVVTNGRGVTKATSTKTACARLNILEVQRLIRFMPKVVIAVVPAGRWAAAIACTSSAISPSPARNTPSSNKLMPT